MRKKLLFLLLALSLCLSLHVTALATSSNANTLVYVTPHGKKYHRITCHYLNDNSYEYTLAEAIAINKTPCSVCKPPIPNFAPLPEDDVEQIDKAPPTAVTSNANSSDGYSGTHRKSTSSSNRSGSGDGHGVMSTGDTGILLLIACAGYGVLRLFNKKPSSPQQSKRSSDAELWNIENYRKQKTNEFRQSSLSR